MEVLDYMSKTVSRTKRTVSKLKPKSVWGKAIRETEERLQQARQRVVQLEEAKESFIKLAEAGVPPPTGKETSHDAGPAA
jgi:hypothetical protein